MSNPEIAFEYIERPPLDPTKKAPLMVLLHGYGSNEKDLFSFASELPKELHIISLRAPLNLDYNSHAWYSINFDADQNKFSDLKEAKSSLEKITIFLNDIIDQKNIDPSKVFVLGFSQGAILSYALALNTGKIPYAIALSGYLNEDLLKDPIHTNTDFFISHGSVDQVIPVEWAQKAPVFLNKKKIENSYKEYPVGHGVHPQNFYDFRNWLEARL